MALLKIDDKNTQIDQTSRDKVWQINVPEFTSKGECEYYNKIKTIDDPAAATFADNTDSFTYVAERTYCKVTKNNRYYWTVSLTDKKPSDFMNVYEITGGVYKGYYYHWNGQISTRASISKLGNNCDYSFNKLDMPPDTTTPTVYGHASGFEYICGKNGYKYIVDAKIDSEDITTYSWTQEAQTQAIMQSYFVYNECIQLGLSGIYWIPRSSFWLDGKQIVSGSVVNSPDYQSQAPVMNVIATNTSKLVDEYTGSGWISGQENVLWSEFFSYLGLTPSVHSDSHTNEYFYVPGSENKKGKIYYYSVDYAEDESGNISLKVDKTIEEPSLTANQCWIILDSDTASYKNLYVVYFNGYYHISSKTRRVALTVDYCNSALTMPTDNTTKEFNMHSNSFKYWDNSNSDFYQVTLTKETKENTTYAWSQQEEKIVWSDPCNEYIYLDGNIDTAGKYWLSTNQLYTPPQSIKLNKTVTPEIADSFKDAIKGGSMETLEGHSANFYYFIPYKDASGNPLSSGEIHKASRNTTTYWTQDFEPISLKSTEVYKISKGDKSGYITKTGQVITNLKGTYDKDKVIKWKEEDN